MTVPPAFQYEPMQCQCGEMIEPRAVVEEKAADNKPGRPKPATRKTALYQCAACGFSYSNARNPQDRTAFAPTADANVPARYRAQLLETLAAAGNINNRASKRAKFAYSTSEDAVTWTIFRWLQDEQALAVVADAAGLPSPKGEPELLLWGSPVGGEKSALSRLLNAICVATDSSPDRLTEPDVVIAWPELVMFIEVKYRAKNERKKDYAHFDKYTAEGAAEGLFAGSAEETANAGWYELTRNWRIGNELAQARGASFGLVNLGPRRLQKEAAEFAATIRQKHERRFAFVGWGHLLSRASEEATFPDDIAAFVEQRQLLWQWA